MFVYIFRKTLYIAKDLEIRVVLRKNFFLSRSFFTCGQECCWRRNKEFVNY